MKRKVILGSVAGVLLLGGSILGVNASNNHSEYLELQDKLATLNITDYSEDNALVKEETLLNMNELYNETYDNYKSIVTNLSDTLLKYDYTLDLDQNFSNLNSLKDYLITFFDENLENIIDTVYNEDIDLSTLTFDNEKITTYVAQVNDEVQNKVEQRIKAEEEKLKEEQTNKEEETQGSNEPSTSSDVTYTNTSTSNTSTSSSSNSTSSNNNNSTSTGGNSSSGGGTTSNNNNSNNGGGNTSSGGNSSSNNGGGGFTGEIIDGTDYDKTCGTWTESQADNFVWSMGYDNGDTLIMAREWIDPSGCLSWSYEWEDGTYIVVEDTGYYELYNPGEWKPFETGQA